MAKKRPWVAYVYAPGSVKFIVNELWGVICRIGKFSKGRDLVAKKGLSVETYEKSSRQKRNLVQTTAWNDEGVTMTFLCNPGRDDLLEELKKFFKKYGLKLKVVSEPEQKKKGE